MTSNITETRKFEWTIHNFTKDALEKMEECVMKDFEILLGQNLTKWFFTCDKVDNWFFVGLNKKYADVENFTVKVEAFIRSVDNGIKYPSEGNDFQEVESKEWGAWLFEVDEFFECPQKCLINDALTLVIKIQLTELKSENMETASENQYLSICKEYFTTKSYSDFTFVCSDGTEIPTHRLILASFSPVMKAMFDTEMIESRINKVNVMDIDGETMTEIMRYIYIQQVNNIHQLAVKLLYGAEKYELNKLKKLCVASMIENLSKENALEYFQLADQYNLRDLFKCAGEFIKSNYKIMREDIANWIKSDSKYAMLLLDCYQTNPDCVIFFESTL